MKTVVVLSLCLAAAWALPRSHQVDNLIRYPHLVMSKEYGLEKKYSAQDSWIADGQPAELGQFPFAVHVQMPIGGGASYVCTGSLISSDIVVAAAHCVQDAVPEYGITVQYGVLNWGTAGPNNVQSGLSDYMYNEDFTFNNFVPITSDIGYVRLDTPIDPADWDGTVDIIPIADVNPNVGDIVTEVGWGYTLSWGQSNVVSDLTVWCPNGDIFFIAVEFFCTEPRYCDDFAALAISNENFEDALLWGVVSFATGNCQSGYYCFTSVVYFRQWLTDNTGEDFGP